MTIRKTVLTKRLPDKTSKLVRLKKMSHKSVLTKCLPDKTSKLVLTKRLPDKTSKAVLTKCLPDKTSADLHPRLHKPTEYTDMILEAKFNQFYIM